MDNNYKVQARVLYGATSTWTNIEETSDPEVARVAATKASEYYKIVRTVVSEHRIEDFSG